VIGVELGGALKNVMAVATGIVEGVGLGYNSRAAIITRGLHEMTRLGVAIGIEVGKGASLEDALAGKETVAEGVATTASAFELAARLDVDMPIVQMVYRILFEGHAAANAVPELMARELRSEQDL